MQRLEPFGRFRGRRAQQRGEIGKRARILGQAMARLLARLGLDAAHARGDRAFADDRDEADVAGARDMGAAAQLHRIGARAVGAVDRSHRDDAHFLAVFLAEQGAGARLARLLDAHQARDDGLVAEDDAIGDVLDRGDLLRRDRLGVGDVEAQPVGRDQRALLRDMVAEHHAQRLVQQMGRGMVGADRRARLVIDLQLQRHADLQRPLLHFDFVDEEVAELLLGVEDARAKSRRGDHADVADLAARLAVERRLIEDEPARLADGERGDLGAVADQRGRDALGDLGLVAEKFASRRRARAARTRRSRSPPRPSRTRPCAPRRAGAPSRRRSRRRRRPCRARAARPASGRAESHRCRRA